MSTLPAKTLKTCDRCNRVIKNDSREIPGIGVFGPECYRKVAGLESILELAGLQDLPQGFTLHNDTPSRDAKKIYATLRFLQRSGLDIRSKRVPGAIHFSINGVKNRKHFVRSERYFEKSIENLEAFALEGARL